MTSVLQIDLKRFDESYSHARSMEPPAPSVVPQAFSLPDGKYRVSVERVELTQAKTSGNPLLRWRFRVVAGQFEGRLLFKNRAITQSTIEWVKKEMQICGLELTPFSSLADRLHELVGVHLAVSKVNKNGNENIYINRRLTPLSEGDLAVLADELPF